MVFLMWGADTTGFLCRIGSVPKYQFWYVAGGFTLDCQNVRRSWRTCQQAVIPLHCAVCGSALSCCRRRQVLIYCSQTDRYSSVKLCQRFGNRFNAICKPCSSDSNQLYCRKFNRNVEGKRKKKKEERLIEILSAFFWWIVTCLLLCRLPSYRYSA